MARCAVFTLGRDERFHLPLWIGYYGQHFDPADMYVLDHDSQDPQTLETLAAFPGNVRHLEHGLIFDHEWLLQTVMATQAELLGRYEYVLFCDTDELIVPAEGTLREFIERADRPEYRCSGYEVVEDHMYRVPFYDKTLLSWHPLVWEYGYHHAVDEPPAQGDLFLYHLHRLNFAEALDKNQRRQRYQFDPVAVANSYSVQNQLTSLEEFRVWFYDTTGLLPFLGTAFGPLEPLDERIRRELRVLGVEP